MLFNMTQKLQLYKMISYAFIHLKSKAGDKLFAPLSTFFDAKLMAIVCLLFGLTHSVGYAKSPGEYQLKAAFLYNVARMVEWPRADANEPLVICLIGSDPFEEALNSIKKKTVKKRPLKFIVLDVPIDNLSQCHVIFIPEAAVNLSADILSNIGNQHILTMGETPNFAMQGGMVNLLKNGERITIEINLKSVKASDIVISSRLLTLAKIVKE